MSSVPSPPIAAPIRQPRGPSSNSFGNAPPPQAPSPGPPAADSDSLLKRHNTVSTPRHQVSSSVSANPAASSAFHGSRLRGGVNRFRSGSLSSTQAADAELVRRKSGREVKTEQVVPEDKEAPAVETGYWAKGLSRQSSLPSRRGFKTPVNAPPLPTEASKATSAAPPRPPRRVQVAGDNDMPPPPSPTYTAHSVSQSLSSLAMFNRPGGLAPPEEQTGANVSRTQSLRDQAKNTANSMLGRSSSLKGAGEGHHRAYHSISPSSQSTTPRHPYTPPTPPPVSSTAALPPMQLPQSIAGSSLEPGADLRRHQSLGNEYTRRLGGGNLALMSLEQREGVRRRLVDGSGHTRKISEAREDEPPTSPVGRSVWSPAQGGDDGWHRPATQQLQLQEALEAMQISRAGGDEAKVSSIINDIMRSQPQPHVQTGGQGAEEPSWVSNLVGGADRRLPVPAGAPNWEDRDALLRAQGLASMPQRWQDQNQALAQQLGYIQHQQNLLSQPTFPNIKQSPSGTPQPPLMVQYQQPFHGSFVPGPYNQPYPTPPSTAVMPHQDQDVIQLARSKGLNPASFNCRPPIARFFVIKSYTEEDVQKSLKHGIWSSTVLGNKRLNTAFHEFTEKGPIFLFFSVNGSRHFCGVAEMLTAVDDSRTSDVWAQDKWKGIFHVKWIFVRDVPTAALRHIRLVNTPEQKPITNSRDTQELHYEAGCEVLSIFLDYQTKSKTSLLQDFAYYEQLAANRAPGQGPGLPSAPSIPQNQQQQQQQQQQQFQQPAPISLGPVPPLLINPGRYR